MTNKQKLIELLEQGFCVEIKHTSNNENEYKNFIPFKTEYGYITNQWGSRCNDFYSIANNSENEINEDFTITKIYRQPIKPFKVGDKVKISESIKECIDFKQLGKYNDLDFNEILTIEIIYNYYDGLRYMFSNCGYSISHEYLIPVIDVRKQVGDEIDLEIEGELRTVKIIK